VERYTTASIERSVLRLLGVEGSLEEKPKEAAPQGRYPLVNEVVDKVGEDALARGISHWFGLAAHHHPKLTPSALARKIAAGEIDVFKLEKAPPERIHQACQAMLAKSIQRLRVMSERRKRRPPPPMGSQPLKYVIVATGNIREDVRQAQAAAEMGADIIAVIRSTAQSLLDYVPEGETSEGYGGTFATQANFRLMREALDQTEKKLRRRIGLTNYSSGLCMPEIAVIGALEGVDYLLNDAMYGILFRDINMKRNFVDQHFSRRICALSEITIQTGEDNYLTTAESHKYWYQVLASHFINQVFAKRAGLHDTAIALGHAFEMDPWVEDSMLYEWGQAQLVRELFPKSPIKFMPPTVHKSGDIFFSYLYDGMFNLASVLTGQSIHLLGMHTEAIHNPFVQDRYLSLKNADYVFSAAKSVADEVTFQSNGKVVRRARQVLDDAVQLLRKVNMRGLMQAIAEGAFANVRRHPDAGKGAGTAIEKGRDYYTPLQEYLVPKPEKEETRLAQKLRREEERRRLRERVREKFESRKSRERRPPPQQRQRSASGPRPKAPPRRAVEGPREVLEPTKVEARIAVTESVSVIALPPPGTDLEHWQGPAPETPASAAAGERFPAAPEGPPGALPGSGLGSSEGPGGPPREGRRRRGRGGRGRRGGRRRPPGPSAPPEASGSEPLRRRPLNAPEGGEGGSPSETSSERPREFEEKPRSDREPDQGSES
jgi:beta-lysine 5,6-aminomutase alpha subunit